jgi:DNA (cytosine-5)-methyltransferase 1
MESMNELALCAGIGGSSLAGRVAGWRTVCAVEWDVYCQALLVERQETGDLPPFPIWDDVRTFDGRPWRGVVDIVTGGFPCQPFSAAGKRQGKSDPRHLWPEIARIIGECCPGWVFLENVPQILSAGHGSVFTQVVGDLASFGYDVAWCSLSAGMVGAPHSRARVWIVGVDSNDMRAKRSIAGAISGRAGETTGSRGDCSRLSAGRNGHRREADAVSKGIDEIAGWPIKSDVDRVADGIPARLDRLHGLGNAWVPACAVLAWNVLSAELEKHQ